jgi:serine/threonine-protein kinase
LDAGLDLGIQICTGLGYAHRAGIVHCDVKPQNIIITNDKVAKLTDFGISRALNSPSSSERSDVVWGSPQYLAPELIEGKTPTPAADVYSLGVVLYEIFTGKPPFEGESINELLTSHTNKTPQPITSQVKGFPEDLDLVISKTLSKETSQRYRSAEQLCSVLTLIRKRISSSPTAYTQESRTAPTNPPQLPVFVSYEDKPSAIHDHRANIDWNLIGLELLCLFLAGGLIPFWIFVWFTIKPLLD